MDGFRSIHPSQLHAPSLHPHPSICPLHSPDAGGVDPQLLRHERRGGRGAVQRAAVKPAPVGVSWGGIQERWPGRSSFMPPEAGLQPPQFVLPSLSPLPRRPTRESPASPPVLPPPPPPPPPTPPPPPPPPSPTSPPPPPTPSLGGQPLVVVRVEVGEHPVAVLGDLQCSAMWRQRWQCGGQGAGRRPGCSAAARVAGGGQRRQQGRGGGHGGERRKYRSPAQALPHRPSGPAPHFPYTTHLRRQVAESVHHDRGARHDLPGPHRQRLGGAAGHRGKGRGGAGRGHADHRWWGQQAGGFQPCLAVLKRRPLQGSSRHNTPTA